MATTGEGTIEIPLEDFWSYVDGYNIIEGNYNLYGKPKVNLDNNTLEIIFAFSDSGDPREWGEKSEAEKSWKEKVDTKTPSNI